MADDGGNDEMEHYFPPLEQVVLPIPREKYPHGGGISQQGPEEDEDEGGALFMDDTMMSIPRAAALTIVGEVEFWPLKLMRGVALYISMFW